MHSLPHHFLSSSDTHTPTDTKSKINHTNKKSTTDTRKSNTPTHEHTNRDRESGSTLVDRHLWQIGACGLVSINAWINAYGSVSISACGFASLGAWISECP